jgi:hypothetical protein
MVCNLLVNMYILSRFWRCVVKQSEKSWTEPLGWGICTHLGGACWTRLAEVVGECRKPINASLFKTNTHIPKRGHTHSTFFPCPITNLHAHHGIMACCWPTGHFLECGYCPMGNCGGVIRN